MERIGFTASEMMSFLNVNGRSTTGRTDGRRMPVLYKIAYEPLKNCVCSGTQYSYVTLVDGSGGNDAALSGQLFARPAKFISKS